MADENLFLKMRAIGARGTAHDVNRVTRSVLGLNAATSKTRVSLGPFSTSLRGASIAVGGFILATKSAVPATLALAEGIGQAGAAAGGVGLVGLTAFAQATVVAKLGTGDLTKALGGNAEAYKKLTPEARRFYNTLFLAQTKLKATAQSGIMPGLQAGAKSALGNLPVANTIVGGTAKTLGGLGQAAGGLLGGKGVGRDIGAIGKANTKIIANMGRATFHLAGGLIHVARAAAPFAVSLSRGALAGSKFLEAWLGRKQATGEMSRFFREGVRDLKLIVSITGNLAGGVLNLFGASDVDGTKTLASLDRLTQKFETWSATLRGKPLGPELQKQMELALAAIASFIGSHIGVAGQTAAGAFLKAFWAADAWGKGITAAFLLTKLGLTKAILGGIGGLLLGGGKGAAAGGLAARGSSPANPLYVIDVAGGVPGVGGVPGKAKGSRFGRLGRVLKVAGPAAAAYGLATGDTPFGHLYNDPKDPRSMNLEELQKKIRDRKANIARYRGVASPEVAAKQREGLARLQTQANTVAYQGYHGIPQVINVQVDGKTIATAVHRAGTKKKSTK